MNNNRFYSKESEKEHTRLSKIENEVVFNKPIGPNSMSVDYYLFTWLPKMKREQIKLTFTRRHENKQKNFLEIRRLIKELRELIK